MKKMLKKLFGKVEGTAADGSTIYKYDELEDRDWRAPEYAQHMVEIEAHFNKCFPGRKTSVMHEIISDTVHLDVHVMYPTEEEPFYVLYTTGMSALKMNVDAEELELAELMIYMPKDWDIGAPLEIHGGDFPEENYWIISYMKWLARFPHEYHTFIGFGHTIPNGADYKPFTQGTTLGGTVLCETIDAVELADGSRINLYYLMLAYKEEIEYKLQHGMDALLAEFEAANVPFITDITRTNVCG